MDKCEVSDNGQHLWQQFFYDEYECIHCGDTDTLPDFPIVEELISSAEYAGEPWA